MRKDRTIIVLGIIIALTPFLGFPSGFKTFLYVVFGLTISILTYLLLREQRYIEPQSNGKTFSESIPKEVVDKRSQNTSPETTDNSNESI
jgi:hypothetical protein